MTAPTIHTPTPAELQALCGFRARTDWKPQRIAPGSITQPDRVAWYLGGPDGTLHAVARWRPNPVSGRIEALCGATSWGWSETDPGTLRGRCSECATRAHGMPLLNPAKP